MNTRTISSSYVVIAFLLSITILIVPNMLNAQDYSTLKRLAGVNKQFYYGGHGSNYSGSRNLEIFYDTALRFNAISARYYGSMNHEDQPPSSWNESVAFLPGYSLVSPTEIMYTTPTMYGESVRTCVYDINGYPLGDHYSTMEDPFSYKAGVYLYYNDQMKLVSELRYQTSPRRFWKTEHTLDDQGRRTQSIYSNSTDSLSFITTNRTQYNYSGETWGTTQNYEKYAYYFPEALFFTTFDNFPNYDGAGVNFKHIYINDTWKLSSCTYSDYVNGEWVNTHTFNVYVSVNMGETVFRVDDEYSYCFAADGFPTSVSYGDYEFSEVGTYYLVFELPTSTEDSYLTPSATNNLSAYPNPFSGSVTLGMELKQPTKLTMSIYNLKGQLVRRYIDNTITKGKHELIWDGQNQNGHPCTVGIYIVRVKTNNTILTAKVVKAASD